MLKETIRRFYILLILAVALLGKAGTAWFLATRQVSPLDAVLLMTWGLLAVTIHSFMLTERDLEPVSVVEQPAR
jgi:hypothetical protein